MQTIQPDEIQFCIPARLESTRIPKKMLLDIGDKKLIEWSISNLRKHVPYSEIYILTDSEEIYDLIEYNPTQFRTIHVNFQDKGLRNGTERCAYKAMAGPSKIKAIVNVQGDLFSYSQLHFRAVVDQLLLGSQVCTVAEQAKEPGAVHAIVTRDNKAKWFTRADIAYGWRHVGIYGYTIDALRDYRKWNRGDYESHESLEQLRWLENGYDVDCMVVDPGQGRNALDINTYSDLRRAVTMIG